MAEVEKLAPGRGTVGAQYWTTGRARRYAASVGPVHEPGLPDQLLLPGDPLVRHELRSILGSWLVADHEVLRPPLRTWPVGHHLVEPQTLTSPD